MDSSQAPILIPLTGIVEIFCVRRCDPHDFFGRPLPRFRNDPDDFCELLWRFISLVEVALDKDSICWDTPHRLECPRPSLGAHASTSIHLGTETKVHADASGLKELQKLECSARRA